MNVNILSFLCFSFYSFNSFYEIDSFKLKRINKPYGFELRDICYLSIEIRLTRKKNMSYIYYKPVAQYFLRKLISSAANLCNEVKQETP